MKTSLERQIEFEEQFYQGESNVNARVVAKRYGLSVCTVYRLAEAGKIPSRKIGGSRRFKISELEAAFKT